jgi:hypothetical protein
VRAIRVSNIGADGGIWSGVRIANIQFILVSCVVTGNRPPCGVKGMIYTLDVYLSKGNNLQGNVSFMNYDFTLFLKINRNDAADG